MKTSTVNLVKLEPSEGMHLRNIHTGEVHESYIFLAKSLSYSDFTEITESEYKKIIEEKVTENGE